MNLYKTFLRVIIILTCSFFVGQGLQFVFSWVGINIHGGWVSFLLGLAVYYGILTLHRFLLYRQDKTRIVNLLPVTNDRIDPHKDMIVWLIEQHVLSLRHKIRLLQESGEHDFDQLEASKFYLQIIRQKIIFGTSLSSRELEAIDNMVKRAVMKRKWSWPK